MNILHVESWRTWFARFLIRQDALERRSHDEGGRKRDMLPLTNHHLLRDVGRSDLAKEPSKDGHR